ncbi:MAG: YcxB family protein [Cellvibrionaceae bacterium]
MPARYYNVMHKENKNLVVKKDFKPTVKTLYKAIREIFHSTKSSWIMYICLVFIPAAYCIYKLITTSINNGHITFLLIALAYSFALLPAVQFWCARRSLLSNPSANQVQNYEISEDGIRNYTEGAEVRLSWDKIIKVKVSKNFLLFFFSRNCAYYLPISLVSSEEIKQIVDWSQRNA